MDILKTAGLVIAASLAVANPANANELSGPQLWNKLSDVQQSRISSVPFNGTNSCKRSNGSEIAILHWTWHKPATELKSTKPIVLGGYKLYLKTWVIRKDDPRYRELMKACICPNDNWPVMK